MAVPTLAEVRSWAELPASRVSDEVLQVIFDAELADQRMCCRVPNEDENYPDALKAALMRRIQRHVAMKALPLGASAVGDSAAVITPRDDLEVKRLERKWRKFVIG